MTNNSIISKSKQSLEKTLKELNMIDAFLFEAVTEKTEYAEKIAKIIIKRTLGIHVQNIAVETEKELKGIHRNKRGIRMDVYAKECNADGEDGNPTKVYDIEPNNYGKNEIPRRSRFYQSMLDVKLLSTGNTFLKLPDVFTIWILPYDPFGDDRMIYTVQSMVVENNQLVYNDGITKIFIFLNGIKGGSEELKNMLRFFADTKPENAVDEDLSELQKIVDEIKQNDEERERYMHFVTYEEMLEDAERKGRYEGKIEGKIMGFITCCRSLAFDRENTKTRLEEQFSLTGEQADEYLDLYL